MLPVRMVTAPDNIPPIDMQILQHPLFENDPGTIWLKQQIQDYTCSLIGNDR